jgi:hypothetical protein
MYTEKRTRRKVGTLGTELGSTHHWVVDEDIPIVHGSWHSSDTLVPYTFVESTLGHREQLMIDSVSDARKRFHDCYHESYWRNHTAVTHQASTGLVADIIGYTSNNSLASRITAPISWYYKNTTIPPEYYKLPREYVEGLFRRDDLWDMDIDIDRDPVDSGFSIWFLIVDVIEMPKLVTGLFGTPALYRLGNSSYTAAQLASTHLGYQFGIKPAVADLRDFIRVLKTWQKAYDRLREQIDQVYTWRSQKEEIILFEPRVIPVGKLHAPGLTYADCLYDRTAIKAVLSRTMQYSFSCPEVTSFLARVKQLIDQLGLLDPVAIWDVLPWSFVVDWFVPIGKWLHRNRKRLFPVDLVVHDYCEAIKIEWSARLKHGVYFDFENDAPSSAPIEYIPGTEFVNEVYMRKRFKPPPQVIKPPRTKSFGDAVTFKRCAISASLIAQRIPRALKAGNRHTGTEDVF